MTVAVLAEKPSVARDIAEALGATRNQGGSLIGRGYVVTWAVGHLVGLAEPHEIDAGWKLWRADRLPMIPRAWPLKVLASGRKQFEIVSRILQDPSVDRIVCATDAGREGELIFRYIYREAGCNKPVARLWISSLTQDAIRAGFSRLRPAREFQALADSAEARSRADWLVGMNLTRAYTLQLGDLFSVGRVQTPTLAMIVERDRAIRDFVPEPYLEVRAEFAPADRSGPSYRGTWFDPARARTRNGEGPPPDRLPADGELARQICERCEGATGEIVSVQGTDKSMPPPLLHDLTELQRQANRLFGLTAGDTLQLAQALYEKHKLISYPRTDSKHLSTEIAATLGPVVAAIAPRYPGLVADGSGQRPLSRRYVDDAKVTDHHAIIPTGARASHTLSPNEKRVYDLICRRLLMAWHGDHKTRTTRVLTRVRSEQAVDSFASSGTMVVDPGWKVLDIQTSRQHEEVLLPSGLEAGQQRAVAGLETLRKETAPPKRHTDATVLTAMESAGKCLDDRELEQAMRERGLGTPATRAAILETLLERQYLRREGKALLATDKGEALIDAVHEKVKSPAMTGEWEYGLKRIEQGQESLTAFMTRIEQYVREVIGEAVQPHAAPLARRLPAATATATTSAPEASATARTSALNATAPARAGAPSTPSQPGGPARVAPRPQQATPGAMGSGTPREVAEVALTCFGHKAFRPGQEDVCRAVALGGDALVVMPTGSGKSLCYQVPGIARGGATLVISPLIALMEDQTARLCSMGLAAERIHSGRPREQSRAACRAWLEGRLQFLMIAPERLAVPGFPEMLARRKPTLIAIDEAHCISHWGHDFRPDYRLIGERIPLLRPAPIVAMTATATLRVQDDILAQLGIPEAKRFIRGFRRDNLAVEVAEASPSQRLQLASSILRDPQRRPAIVYVPTRKAAEQYATAFSRRMRAAAYHAGMMPDERGRVQEAFLGGSLEVVVATIAFGMGVDKADVRTVIHVALPGTVEGYYQEIGRAGRDGKPSRAILLYSFADRRMHESFLARDYPPAEVLHKLRGAVPPAGMERELLVRRSGLEPEHARAAIDKLFVHGGLTIDADDRVHVARADWEPRYEAIRAHRAEQLELVFGFAQSGGCRMLRLVRHFGDRDDRELCGICDECTPEGCTSKRFRTPTAQESDHLARLLQALSARDGMAAGTLHRSVFGEDGVDRRTFEAYVDAMVRCKVVSAIEETFEKDGKSIRYRRIHLRASGESVRELLGRIQLMEKPEAPATRPRKRPRKAPGPDLLVSRSIGARKRDTKARAAPKRPASSPVPGNTALVTRLRAWRLAISGQRRIPAYRVLTDEALYGIAASCPGSLQALLQVRGVGPKIVEQFGTAILAMVRA